MSISVSCFRCFGDQNPVADGIAGALQSEVGNLFSLIWSLTLGAVTNLVLLGQNADRLELELEELKEMRDDVMSRVQSEEARPLMEGTHQVKGWLQRVEKFGREVDEFRASLERQSICITGFYLGYSAADKLKRVRRLKSQGNDFNQLVGVTEAPPGAGTLAAEMDELRAMRDEVVRRVESEEAQSLLKRTPQVKGWLERVENLDAAAQQFQASSSSSTESGRATFLEKLKQVRELKSQRANNMNELVGPARPGADTLAEEMDGLREMRDDVMSKVEFEELKPHMKCTHQVKGWLERVAAALDAAAAAQPTEFLGDSPEGRSIFLDKLRQIRELKSGRNSLGELVSWVPPDPVEQVPLSTSFIVGGEKTLSTIRGHLRDEGVGLIGVYGMGGIGKTTLLRKINNEFLEARSKDFDVVILANVSHDPDIFKIQEDISIRLGFSRREEDQDRSLPINERDRTHALFRALSRKKFLLLLDDVWKELDLAKIGIPRPNFQNKGKIVFTTRSREVCADMDADKKVQVSFLNEEESWQLFLEKVGAEEDLKNNPSFGPLAATVLSKCGGLPLALIVVGRAMAEATTVGEWEEAATRLSESPDEVRNMEEKVLSILKFSFDRLNNESTRQCLLYCCLFPEDHEIDVKELIEYWVGEGFLDAGRSDSVARARNRGYGVITKLKSACLLESGGIEEEDRRYVKMHDVVREMTVWLTGGEYDKKNMFLVDAEKGLRHIPMVEVERWGDAKRISLMYNEIEKLPSPIPACPNLSTLLINRHEEIIESYGLPVVVPESFFKYMLALRVLDLSWTKIAELPDEVGLLVELQYLNLSHTSIEWLPSELGKLVKLRQLDLRGASELSRIPCKAIVTLTRLQALNLYQSFYYMTYEWSDSEDEDEDANVTLMHLERSLVRLEELGVNPETSASLEALASSDRLSRCTTFLELVEVSGLTPLHLSTALEKLRSLRQLHVGSHPEWDELRFDGGGGQLQSLEVLRLSCLDRVRIVVDSPTLRRLRELRIEWCDGFKDLTWIRQLPCLEDIWLKGCDGIEELLLDDAEIHGDDDYYDRSSFPELKVMSLQYLSALRSISSPLLLLPSLEHLQVLKCPQLKKLPLGPDSAKKLRVLEGSQEWWDRLEWKHPDGGQNRPFLALI